MYLTLKASSIRSIVINRNLTLIKPTTLGLAFVKLGLYAVRTILFEKMHEEIAPLHRDSHPFQGIELTRQPPQL